MEARILAVADAFDAMMHERPYRKALSKEQTVAELKRCAGTQFDPAVVEAFLTLLNRRGDDFEAAPANESREPAAVTAAAPETARTPSVPFP